MPSSSVLRPALDVARLVRETVDDGASIAFDIIDHDFYGRLEREVSAGPFQPMAEEQGRARQGGEIFRTTYRSSAYPHVRQLGEQLVRVLHESSGSVEGVSEWLPNEVDVQRYHALALGITPHLDLKRYRVLIAIVTVGHSAPFSLCKDREGAVSEQWQAEPGSLVLLRAPGLGGAEDGRPLHAVGGPPVGTRMSITWRMNSREDAAMKTE